MKYLTKQEQSVLTMVLALLLIGWAVKAYRTATAAPASNHTVQSR